MLCKSKASKARNRAAAFNVIPRFTRLYTNMPRKEKETVKEKEKVEEKKLKAVK
jgi:hypothetical protein